MLVHDTEVLAVGVERKVAMTLEAHQEEMIAKCLELSDATKRAEVQEKLAEFEKKEIELKHNNKLHRLNLEREYQLKELDRKAKYEAEVRAQREAERQAEADMQKIVDAIEAAKLERAKKSDEAKIETEKKLAEIEKSRQEAYAATVKTIIESISEDLVAALTANANADMLETVTEAMAPYAIASGESVADVTNKLLRGTTLEGVIDKVAEAKIK